jgi:PIN domain nuclease of toxin-antitoxin system
MKLLFDTHAFIWWDSNPSRLSPQVLAACQDRANSLILSVVSVWELQIKSQLGKLKLNLPLATLTERQIETNGIQVLPVSLPHVLALESMPLHHKDPFDRLLVAQAIVEDAVLVTRDSAFAGYSAKLFW